MDYVNIQTAQNVTIQYEIASLGDRIGAYLLDGLVLVGYIILIGLIFNFLSEFDAGSVAIFVILILPLFFYDLIMEYATDGQSVGKKVLNIKVVMLDGTQPGIGAYFLRWLLRLVDFSLCSGAIAVIAVAAGGKGQRIGDIAAGTTVVKLRERVTLEQISIPEVQDSYTPQYPQVTGLSDNDIAIIRETLRTALKQNNDTLLDALTVKVCGMIGAEKPANPTEFLKTVLKDYTRLTQHDGR
jgi:uncharacterized RDD family membrane protein YckC